MDKSKGRWFGLMAGVGFVAASIGSAEAQRRSVAIDVDQNGQAVAVRNIEHRDVTRECARASGTGRVTSVQAGRDGLLDGVRYQDDRFGASFVNVSTDVLPTSHADKRRIDARLREILAIGNRVRLVIYGCGAAGRIEKLDAVTLVSGPSGALTQGVAASPPVMTNSSPSGADPLAPTSENESLRSAPVAGGAPRVTQEPTSARPVQTPQGARWTQSSTPGDNGHSLTTRSSDRRLVVHLNCNTQRGSSPHFRLYLETPASFILTQSADFFRIDGSAAKVELDGADEFIVLSDATVANNLVVSAALRQSLAKASSIMFIGKNRAGRPKSYTIDVAGSEAIFSKFEERCARKR